MRYIQFDVINIKLRQITISDLEDSVADKPTDTPDKCMGRHTSVASNILLISVVNIMRLSKTVETTCS